MSTAADVFGSWLSRHSRFVLGGAIAITVLLVLPMTLLVPTETASQSPTNEVTMAQDELSARFASPIHEIPLVVEAVDGNILSPASLLAIRQRTESLRSDPEVSPFLVSRFIPELEAESPGVFTIADAVDQALRRRGGTLVAADQAEVEAAVANLIEATGPRSWGLAQQTQRDSSGRWSSPALIVAVEADNAGLGGGANFVAIGATDLTKEEFSRQILGVFREGAPALRTWTIATDVNLTSIEQGTRAGPFIGLTVFVVLMILLLAFRSYWLTAVAALSLGSLMIWLKGLANLVGLDNDQLLATIVPIGMISFGIDSVFHVHGRYREVAATGYSPRRAFGRGTAAVIAPVMLALSSDSAAFLSNLSSPIESVRQFGIAAALAALAASLLLGVCTPLAIAEIEERRGTGPLTRWGMAGDLAFGAAASAVATAAVLLIVFVSPLAGAVLLVLYGLVAIALPLLMADPGFPATVGPGPGRPADLLAPMVERFAGAFGLRPLATLFGVAFPTGFVLFFALQVSPSFEVTDFFSPDVDFVVGIDKVTHYAGTQAGEPATVLIEGDLSEPEALAATARFVDRLRAVDSHLLANEGGAAIVSGGIVDLVRDAMNPGYSVPESTAGWRADVDADGLPDSRADVEALFAAVRLNGVVNSSGRPLWTPETVGTVLGTIDDRGTSATQVGVEVPDTSDQASVTAVRRLVEPMASDLAEQLRATDTTAQVTFTGSPVFRDEQLKAIVRSLLLSLPIALLACVLLAAGFTRSLRLAVLSTIPVLLVVIWLYGFMALAGFGINVVTAMIGAISIGVGIDFAAHMTMRMLEETRSNRDRRVALRAAVGGTGTALVGSALTSIAGFAVLALAPMPMFATYGLLTAMMILFALVASLVVLPSLLLVFGDLPEHPEIDDDSRPWSTIQQQTPPAPVGRPIAVSKRPQVVR